MSAEGSSTELVIGTEPLALPAREDHAATRRPETRGAALQRLERRDHEALVALSAEAATMRPAPVQVCIDWDLALCPAPPSGIAPGD